MSTKQKTQKENSQLVSLTLVGIVMAALVGYMVIFVTPIAGEIPVEITEEVEILAVTQKESYLKHLLECP